MNPNRLALRLTLNSLVMILGVYILMQSLVFIRDNIILGINDFSAMAGTVANFIVGSVLPPMVVFTIMIFLVGLRIQRVHQKLVRGETLSPEILEKTRKRIIGFSTMILVINVIGFVVGYILSMVLSGKAADLVAPSGILILVSNLAGSIAYAYAQSALNNLAFADLRERLGITRIGERAREMPNTFRQVILTGLLAIYVLTLLQMNLFDLMRAKDIETRTLDAIRTGEVSPEKAALNYRERLAKELYSFSTRTTLDVEKVPLPWERAERLADIEFQVFLIFGLFAFSISFGIQLAWSTDLRRQLLALMQRLRDVVAGGGDLTKRIHLRTMDDIGEITDLVNQLLDQFQTVVKRIGAAADQTRQTSSAIDQVLSNSESIAHQSSEAFLTLRDSLENQAAQSQKLTHALQSFSAAVSGVNSAVETQRSFVTDSSAAMEEMASNIESVETMTARSQTLTTQLSEQGGSGGAAVNETSQAISSIEESSRQVMKVLGELNKIAASTNLLAMNAAIEAAHAGERGKGFAVVAEEVRKLANSSSAQTGAIRELIQTMSRRVGKGVETAKSSGQALEDLVSGLQSAALISSEISGAMKEQAIGTRSAADSLLRIVDASDTIHQRMEDQGHQTRQMTSILTESIDQLGILVSNAREQTRQITGLENAFAAVRKEVTQNSRAVSQLQAEIERFKVE